MIENFKLERHLGEVVAVESKSNLVTDRTRLDIHYEIENGRIFIEIELMTTDEPSIVKFLTYIFAVDVFINQSQLATDNLVKLVKRILSSQGVWNDVKSKVDSKLKKDFSNFDYTNMQTPIDVFEKGIKNQKQKTEYNELLTMQNRIPLQVSIMIK